MSSIIDALKKSDQNRNNDNQSDLNQINFSDTNTVKSRRGFWLLLLLLLLLATVVFAWQKGWHTEVINYVKSWSNPVETSAVTNDSSEATETEQMPQLNNNTKPAAQVNQLIPPKQSEIKAQTKKINQKVKNPPSSANEEEPSQADAFTNKNNQIKPVKTPEVTATADTTEQIKPINDVIKPTDSSKPKDRSLEPMLKQDFLLIHQIDYAIRKDIPEIKINIHIYDPEPDNRMVLINGERYNIGDTISESVDITDIVQEGIVVTYQDIKFLIPK